MKAALLDFFAAAANGAAVHIRHRLEESGIKLDRIFRFRESEFGNRSIELKLQALQYNRVENLAFRALPAQDAVSQHQLHPLRFTVDAAVERIEGLKEAHRLARWFFAASPFVALRRPAAKSGQPRWNRRELHGQFFAISLGFLARLDDASQVERIVPARLQPGNNFIGRFRSLRQLRTLDAQGKSSAGSCFRLPIGALSPAGAGLRRALPDGWMHRQVMQPKMPGLFLD